MGKIETEESKVKLIRWAEGYYTVRDDLRSLIGHQSIFDEFTRPKKKIANPCEIDLFLLKCASVGIEQACLD